MAEPILEMSHVSKRFDMTQALDDVSLALYPGEVHGLVGENGAGKSTLIKIMTGIYRPDQGEMLLDGQPIQVHNSQQAQAHGIAAIQYLMPNGTPAEIETDVAAKIRALGAGGGYMCSPAHIVQSDTSMENVEAFIAAVKKHGVYD